jgi:lipopolysaccharide transport system ATP-binding protein
MRSGRVIKVNLRSAAPVEAVEVLVVPMRDTVITVEDLSKRYLLGHKSGGQRDRNDTFRDVIGREARDLVRNAVNLLRGRQIRLGEQVEEFWALKDVSFEVKRGEVLGIIGRNGAGKSTLLKILSRITEPTRGRVVIRGRVASLLEVGTGFHQELTGRENIYLNGAILGMSRAEIRRKFDEIVAFSEVEKFLDTPVKRYSSGMYVRLAFAVAAHLEPEILVVDEVLAVGDAEFQKKCLGKMSEIAGGGRTVLFVSHNMAAVRQLCHNGIWLQNGQIEQLGPISLVGNSYSGRVIGRAASGNFSADCITGDGSIELISYCVTNGSGSADPPPTTNEDLLIYVRLNVKTTIPRPEIGIDFTNQFGTLLTSITNECQDAPLPPLPVGERTICVRIKRIAFLPGTYISRFWIKNLHGHTYVRAEESISFEIARTPVYGTRDIDPSWGCVYSDIVFSVEPSADNLGARNANGFDVSRTS